MDRKHIFQLAVIELKLTLESIKADCDANESMLIDKHERIEFVKKLQRKHFEHITQFFIKLSSLAANEDVRTYRLLKSFLRENLYDLIAGSTMQLNKQICEKPFGYAGDYLVADYFYQDGYSGSSLYGMLMDRYTIESPLARAHINRRYYLRKMIKKIAGRNPARLVRITSLACGPAPEVFDVFDEDLDNVVFNLLDGERRVIDFLRDRIKNGKYNKERITLFHDNILLLLRKNKLLDIPPQDLVYCAGFFDYIRPATATKLIRYMLEHVTKRGYVVVVNISKDDVHNVYLRMIGEWEMYHRSKKEFADLVPSNGLIAKSKIVIDPITKRNLYLVIKKA